MPDIEAIKKTVFFVTRIDKDGSTPRERSDDVMKLLLRPVLEKVDPELTVVRADELAPVGRITDKIVHHLLHSAVIVVDATGRNPNVFYELGVAHAFHRPVILIVDDPDQIPFDTNAEGHLILPGDGALLGRVIEQSKQRLTDALKEALDPTTPPPGPVASAEAQLTPTSISGDEANELLRTAVTDLYDRMDQVEHDLQVQRQTRAENVSRMVARGRVFGPPPETPQMRSRDLVIDVFGRLVAGATVTVTGFEVTDRTVMVAFKDAHGGDSQATCLLQDLGAAIGLVSDALHVPEATQLEAYRLAENYGLLSN